MKLKSLSVLSGLVLLAGFAEAAPVERLSRAPVSAIRNADESYHDAVERFSSRLFFEDSVEVGMSAFDLQVQSFSQIDTGSVAQVESAEVLQKLFETYRDLRYLADPDDETFLRRLSWMYPDDGCFLRAELFGRLLEIEKNPAISKIFVFGDLSAPTPNHPRGLVRWWYHVAPLYRVGDVAWVLDPSVEPLRPLTIAEWGQRVGDHGSQGQTSLGWSVCAGHAVDPFSDCLNPRVEEETTVKSWISNYLHAERSRVVELGRAPNEVLGDFPPWKTVQAPPPPQE